MPAWIRAQNIEDQTQNASTTTRQKALYMQRMNFQGEHEICRKMECSLGQESGRKKPSESQTGLEPMTSVCQATVLSQNLPGWVGTCDGLG